MEIAGYPVMNTEVATLRLSILTIDCMIRNKGFLTWLPQASLFTKLPDFSMLKKSQIP